MRGGGGFDLPARFPCCCSPPHAPCRLLPAGVQGAKGATGEMHVLRRMHGQGRFSTQCRPPACLLHCSVPFQALTTVTTRLSPAKCKIAPIASNPAECTLALDAHLQARPALLALQACREPGVSVCAWQWQDARNTGPFIAYGC